MLLKLRRHGFHGRVFYSFQQIDFWARGPVAATTASIAVAVALRCVALRQHGRILPSLVIAATVGFARPGGYSVAWQTH